MLCVLGLWRWCTQCVTGVGFLAERDIRGTESRPLLPDASHLEIFLPDLKLDSCDYCVLISEANYLKFLNLLDRIFIKTENRWNTILKTGSQHSNISQSVDVEQCS